MHIPKIEYKTYKIIVYGHTLQAGVIFIKKRSV